jgi:hypothetical protein
MYTIRIDKGTISILDMNGKPVYFSEDDAFIIQKTDMGMKVEKVKNLTDEQLLMAVANAVTIGDRLK